MVWQFLKNAIPTLITLFAVVAIVRVAIIYFRKVLDWFRERSRLKMSDKDNIAFTLQENLNNGDYVVYQGVFNTQTEELLDGQKIISSQVDSEFAQLHKEEPLVVYQ